MKHTNKRSSTRQAADRVSEGSVRTPDGPSRQLWRWLPIVRSCLSFGSREHARVSQVELVKTRDKELLRLKPAHLHPCTKLTAGSAPRWISLVRAGVIFLPEGLPSPYIRHPDEACCVSALCPNVSDSRSTVEAKIPPMSIGARLQNQSPWTRGPFLRGRNLVGVAPTQWQAISSCREVVQDNLICLTGYSKLVRWASFRRSTAPAAGTVPPRSRESLCSSLEALSVVRANVAYGSLPPPWPSALRPCWPSSSSWRRIVAPCPRHVTCRPVPAGRRRPDESTGAAGHVPQAGDVVSPALGCQCSLDAGHGPWAATGLITLTRRDWLLQYSRNRPAYAAALAKMELIGRDDDEGSERSFSFSSLNILPKNPPRTSLAKTVDSLSPAPAPAIRLKPAPEEIPAVKTKRSWANLRKPSSSPISRFASSAGASAPAPKPAAVVAPSTAQIPAPVSSPPSQRSVPTPAPVSEPATSKPVSRSHSFAHVIENQDSAASNRPLSPVTEGEQHSLSPPSVFSMNDDGNVDEPVSPSYDATEPTTADEDSDEVGYDLKAPPPTVAHADVGRLSLQFFSVEHLDLILADHELKAGLSRFLAKYRPQHVQTLERHLEARKAEMAIDYANSLAEKMSTSVALENHKFLVAADVHETFTAVSRATTEELVGEALPAYLTHRLVSLVTDSLVKEITGNNVPVMKDLIPSLAEVYCVTDPNMPDNPIVYASEGPDTDRKVVQRLVQALAEGREICETILNYRRDGSPFLNLLMMAPLYDNKGQVRYFLGAQIDVSSLVEEGRGVESFSQLLRFGHERRKRQERRRNMKEVLVDLGDMMSEEEVTTIYNGRKRSDSNLSLASSMTSVHKHKPPPSVPKHRKILGMDDDDRELWSSPKLGNSGRLPGVYQNYLLVRPYPSLRITFTSPALRIPGLLQNRLLDRIGGPEHVRQGILEALSTGTGVTAKITWLVRDRNSANSDEGGKARWIHCTPLLGSDEKVGVWMVVMVEGEQVTGALLNRGLNVSQSSIARRGSSPNGGDSDSSASGGHSRREASARVQDRTRTSMGGRAGARSGTNNAAYGSTSRVRSDKMAGPDRNHLYAEYLRGQKGGGRAHTRPRMPEGAMDSKAATDQFADF
nr:phototropin-2 [Quercus suber]